MPDIDLAVIERHAAVHHIAADEIGARARHLGIIGPADISRLCVDRIDHAPVAGGVDDAVFHQRRGFQPAGGAEFMAPGQPQLADGLLVDLVQRTEAMVVIGPPVHQPVARVLVGAAQLGVAERRGASAGAQKKKGRKNRAGDQAVLQHGRQLLAVNCSVKIHTMGTGPTCRPRQSGTVKNGWFPRRGALPTLILCSI